MADIYGTWCWNTPNRWASPWRKCATRTLIHPPVYLEVFFGQQREALLLGRFQQSRVDELNGRITFPSASRSNKHLWLNQCCLSRDYPCISSNSIRRLFCSRSFQVCTFFFLSSLFVIFPLLEILIWSFFTSFFLPSTPLFPFFFLLCFHFFLNFSRPHIEWHLKALSMVPATEGGVLPPQIISIDCFNQLGSLGPTVGITLSQKKKAEVSSFSSVFLLSFILFYFVLFFCFFFSFSLFFFL